MDFTEFDLHPDLLDGIDALNFKSATPIQEKAIPLILQGKDLIGVAQTGTGKTAAFVLPILNEILESGESNYTQALVIVPTRELAIQIDQVVAAYSYFTGVSSIAVFGGGDGKSFTQEKLALTNGADIIIATPGRLIAHMNMGYVNFSKLRFLVLDEADRMFDMGFLPDVRRIVKAVPAKRQTMFFSATFPADVELLAQQVLTQPQKIAMGIVKPAHTVTHALYPVPPHLKSALLLELLKRTDTDSVLVFTRTKYRAQKVSQQILRAGFKVTSLHGDRSQGQRQSALKGFKDGTHNIMVATDIAARGLDVESISHVINYDMPDTADAYIHRIGRTGRAQRTGDAFTLITDEDKDMIKILERIMGGPIKRETLEGFDYTRPAPPKTDSGRGRGAPREDSRRPPRPAPTPKSYGRNRLAPRKIK